MDDGPTDGPPGKDLRTVSVELSPEEAQELVEALAARAEDDFADPGWHVHISDDAGRELTIYVSGDARFDNRMSKPPSEGGWRSEAGE